MTKLRENEVRIVDALFQEMAERNNRGLSAEYVIDGSWLLFERGCLRLVNDGKHMGIEPCDRNRAESDGSRQGKRLVAHAGRPLMARLRYRRRNKPARTRSRNWPGVSGADTGFVFVFSFALAATVCFAAWRRSGQGFEINLKAAPIPTGDRPAMCAGRLPAASARSPGSSETTKVTAVPARV